MQRGRGDAEMIWGEETPGSAERFAPQALPEGRAPDPEHSGLMGVAGVAPEVAPTREAAGGAAAEVSLGSSAWSRRLAPRHRQAVRRFFSPDSESSPEAERKDGR